MKKLTFLLLLFCIYANSQTFEVVNNGYYFGKVGYTILPNRTTDLKALTDVQEYLEKHNMELGEVVRPKLTVKRKKVAILPPAITDTIIINNGDISIGNQWMGEPITNVPLTGMAFATPHYGNSLLYFPTMATDNNLSTFYASVDVASEKYIGVDLGTSRTITKMYVYPRSGFTNRIYNLVPQGSNTSMNEGFVDIGTSSGTLPQDNLWFEFAITDSKKYRYVRWLLKVDSQSLNVAEIKIEGY